MGRLADASALASPYPFEEVPAQASRISWVHTAGKSAAKYLPETTGAGCAFLDYDNDGWMDIYLVNSGKCDFYNPNPPLRNGLDRKSTRLNSSHPSISYAVFCLKKKNLTLLFSRLYP